MDQSTEYQQDLQLQQHHQQQQNTASETYDPYQVQMYDQSTQAYYTHHQYDQQQYPYYHHDYTNAYQQYLHQQQSQQEPTSIHPPGVPIPHQPTQFAGPEQIFGQNSYYSEGVVDQQQQQLNSQQWQGNNGGFEPVSINNGPHFLSRQSPYRGAGRRGARPFRGGGRSHFARGRGGGRGRHFPSNSAAMPAVDPVTFVHGEASQIQASQIQGEPPQTLMPQLYTSGPVQAPLNAPAQVRSTPIRQPPRMAWCELCRVDCNTYEILEQHKNGKRHKKNLKIYEELQNLKKLLDGQNEQIPVSEIKPEVSVQLENVGGSGNKQPSQKNLSSEGVTENKIETDEQKVSDEQEPTEEPAEKQRMDRFEALGRGLKRKTRGSRGGKRTRTYEGSRRQVEPPKPKEVIPLICELCNVKCESQVVFETHLAGKKHLSNFKRFQDQQAMLGQAALQALYPALQALYPALQALCTPNSNASTSFAPQFHQGVHGPQGFFPQPGPLMFPEGQASGPGTTSVSSPPPVLDIQDQQDSKPRVSQVTSEAANNNVVAKPQQEPVTVKFEAEPASSKDNKSKDRKSESKENHPNDNSVVALLDDNVAGSDQVSSGTATGDAGMTPKCQNLPSVQVVIP